MLKRMISLVLCLAMVITILPVRVFSVEEIAEPAETEVVTPEGSGEILEESESAGETLPSKEAEEETVPETMPEETEPVTIPEETIPGETVEEILVLEPIEPVDALSGVVDSGICGAYNTDAITWVLYDGGILEFTGTGNMYETTSTKPWASYREVITEVVVNEGVTSVCKDAFSRCTNLTGVVLPEGLRSIGDSAFSGCTGLIAVEIPEGVTQIGEEAFFGCSALQTVVLPDTLETIENYAFWNCSSLVSIDLPDSLETLEYGAFSTCESLTHLTIPSGVTYIDAYLVRECPKLEWIEFYNTVVEIDEGVLWNSPSVRRILFHGTPEEWAAIKKHTNFEGQLKENNGVVCYMGLCGKGHTEQDTPIVEATCTEPGLTGGKHCAYCREVLTVPVETPALGHSFSGGSCTRCSLAGGSCGQNLTWTLDGEGTLTISGTGTMANYSSANYVPWYSKRTEIKSVVIENGVTSIGSSAFYGCSSLSSITIPESVTSIGGSAFRYCSSLSSITIPEGVTSIGSYAFNGCSSLSSITIPNGVTSIGSSAFSGCSSLSSITIPEGVTSIGSSAFYGCSSLSSISIPEGVTSIGNSAFYGCSSLSSITIPEGVTSIGSSAFYGCSSLSSITIPEGVTSIGLSAFSDCSSLSSITIPESVTSIGGSAFSHCSSLSSITIPDGVTSIAYYTFYYCKNLGSITIPEGVTSIGSDAFSGCSSLSSITIPEGVTSIGSYAFNGCSSLSSITIPQRVTSIDYGVFYGCSSLSSITIPEGVTSIGSSAFYNCSSLSSIIIPESVTSIGNYAFSNCSSLSSIILPEGITAIADYTFYDCENLVTVTIPEGVTSIGSYAFSNCSSLSSITLPMGITAIADYTFYYCKNLGSITIPESVTSIGGSAFSHCSSLSSITILEGVTSIGSYAFYYCSRLGYVVLPATLKRVYSYAFDACNALNHVFYPGSYRSMTIDYNNTRLTNAKWDYNSDGTEAVWVKNCENTGWFCTLCNDFITREKTTSGKHTYTDTADISCNDCDFVQKLTSVGIQKTPAKTKYNIFTEELDLSGSVLRLSYDDGAVVDTEITADMVTGFDNTQLGSRSLQVIYGDYYQYFSIRIVPGTPDALEIVSPAVKTTYLVGESLDQTGLALSATYDGYDTIDLPLSYVTTAAPDMKTPGTKTVKLTVGEISVSYDIQVYSQCRVEMDSAGYPESDHNYSFNTDETKTYTVPGAYQLTLTFSKETSTESESDNIYLYDGQDNQIAVYSGTQASGKTVVIPGDTVKVRLVSDNAVNKYGYSFTSIVATMTEHVFSDWTVTKEASCGQEGSRTRTCLGKDCGYTETEMIPAMEHTEVIDPAVEATCTTGGLTEGSHCNVCGEVLVPQSVIPAAHHPVTDKGYAATCTKPGLSTGSHCEVCGETLEEQTEIPATGHDFTVYGDRCFECGLMGGSCGENAVWILDSGTLIISGTGATADYSLKIGGTPSASISSPWFEYRDNIGRIIVEEGITEIGDYGIAGCTSVRVVEIAASVRTIGLNALEFNLNGTVDITFKGNAPAFNNSFWSGLGSHRVIYPDQDPTWTKEVKDSCGSDVYWVGECCRSGHGGTITLEGKAATCTENGLTQGTQCTRCGNEVEKQRTIAAVGHTEVIDPAVDATCDVPGLTEGSHCSTCGEILIPQETVIKNHNFGMLYGYCLNCGIGKANCGNGLKWHYDTGTNTLSIFGEGSMNGYSSSMVTGSNAPWTLISNISNLVIKEGVTSIGNYAFYKTSVRNVYLPQGLTSIGTKAFGVSNVVTLEMPASLQSVGGNAFENCGSLKSITFTGNAPQFGSGCFSGTTLTVYYPENDPTWTETVRQSYGGNVTWTCESCRVGHVEIEIPGMDATCTTDGLTDGRKCTVCGDMTVKQEVIPAGHSRKDPVCEFCGVYGVCGDDLTWSFDDNSGILTIIGTGAMYDFEEVGSPWWEKYHNQILKVELPDGITSLSRSAFPSCYNLKNINLPDGINSIPDFAFSECRSLENLTIPDSVKHIGEYALDSCLSLTSLVIPDAVETVEFGAFYNCTNLKEVTLPDSLKELGACAFKYCSSLETIRLSESLSTIHYKTFWDCTSLKEITIPKSVTEIGYHAFVNCTDLKTLTFTGSAPQPAYGEDDPHFAPLRDLTADAWYPGEDTTWTDEAKAKLGGTLNWIPVGSMDNRLMLNGDSFSGLEIVWIDGVEYAVQQDGMNRYIDLPDGNARIMTAYEYHIGDPSDVHTQYPISMKVWTLENDDGVYTATRQEDFDDILQYAGVSIRVTGKKGIRMITAIDQEKKKDLITDGLAGYALKEYGTAIAWAGRLSEHDPLVLGKSYVQSNYAYKRDVADSVFRYAEGLIHYTNVLVNFSNEQCKNDIAMRPYMILEDQWGDEVTIYGGIVERSIGYIAYMNRNAFKPDTDAYEYIWDIIHSVYGDAYDEEYAPSWTKPIK